MAGVWLLYAFLIVKAISGAILPSSSYYVGTVSVYRTCSVNSRCSDLTSQSDLYGQLFVDQQLIGETEVHYETSCASLDTEFGSIPMNRSSEIFFAIWDEDDTCSDDYCHGFKVNVTEILADEDNCETVKYVLPTESFAEINVCLMGVIIN
ncbi:hypothetical protein HDE_09154 [Halotydeus destructor]|nr:hypothetical protein HDE_09154 [Halotydeus destructor]